MMEEEDDDDDIFLTPNDVEQLEAIELPQLRKIARKHLVEYNNEVANKISIIKNRQERHASDYVHIMGSTYRYVRARLDETPDIEKFIVSVRGIQATMFQPSVDTWLRFNRAKGDALNLLANEMKEQGREVSFSVSDVFFMQKDRYYSGGERLIMYASAVK